MTLSKERINTIWADGDRAKDWEVEDMAAELLERRERDKQEPVGYTYNRGINCEIVAADLNADCPCGIDLYAAPPAPVVPEECPAAIRDLIASTCDELFDDDDAQQIWGACRAAMLKGGQS